jgi:hypothetical protein
MFNKGKHAQHKRSSPDTATGKTDRRITLSRRCSCDTKYLGLGRCIDRRKSIRRKVDQFDEEAYERLCHKNLGPGWL